MRGRTGLALRVAAFATALLVGPATLAPGTADPLRHAAPTASAAAGEQTTAAKRYGWRRMQWDFAWEFGESLDSPPYRGADSESGRWQDASTGTGRVVKWGGGIEFHSGERYAGSRDLGTTTLTMRDQPARRGRWELPQRFRFDEANGQPAPAFVVELIPADPAQYDCGRRNITIARGIVGSSTIRVGANAGGKRWTRTLTGFEQGETENRLYGLQVTRRRITWFVNGLARASLAAPAALPKQPMTVRMRLVGEGTTDRRKTKVLVDWVRHYDLRKGKRPPSGLSLKKGAFGGDC